MQILEGKVTTEMHEFDPDIAGLDPEHCRRLDCGQRAKSKNHFKVEEKNFIIPSVEAKDSSVKAELWEVGPRYLSGGVTCREILVVGVDRLNGGFICNAVDGVAQSIVRDHNAFDALVEVAHSVGDRCTNMYAGQRCPLGFKDVTKWCLPCRTVEALKLAGTE